MKTIMDMALEAGFTERELIRAVDSITRFAALVRADERDRMCEQFNISKELAHEKAKGNEAD